MIRYYGETPLLACAANYSDIRVLFLILIIEEASLDQAGFSCYSGVVAAAMTFAECRWIILHAMNKLFEILKPFIDPKAVDQAVFYVPNNALTADELKVLYSYHTDFTADRVFIPYVTNHVGTRYTFSSNSNMIFMVTVYRAEEPSDNIDIQG